MPSGSSLRRPTGNLCRNFLILHCTSLFVVQIISVHSRSSAESTNEAIKERDEEPAAATTLAMRRMTLAATLIWAGHQLMEGWCPDEDLH